MTDTSLKPIKLSGRLDTTRVGEIETPFYAQIGAAKTPADKVLIDMKEVEFISSLGIRMLVTAAKTLSQRKVSMGILAPASNNVKEALDLAGLTDIFRLFDSEEAAYAAL